MPAFREAGSGPLLLFLHGLGGNRHAFEPQFEVLQHRFHCVAWDMPGYGDSDPLASMSFDALAGCLQDLIDHLGVRPAALIGHSLGGMIAQHWVTGGGSCDHLVLAQTTARFGKPGSSWNAEFLADRLKPLDAGQTPADFARSLIESMFFDQTLRERMELAVATMAPIPAAAYRQAIETLVTFDGLEGLSRIAMPTLCLAAEHDNTAPPAAVQKLAAGISDATYVCLPGAGHLAYLETPDAFAAAIVDFLEPRS